MRQDNKFKFTTEPSAPGCFTLVDCGHLRKYIAYLMNDERANLFGTIRYWELTTLMYDELKQYIEPTQILIEKHGQINKDKMLLEMPDTQIKELKITAQLPIGKVELSILRKYIQSDRDFNIAWHHANWNDIPNILNYVQKIWLEFSSASKGEHNQELRISGLRNFAKIHYYFAPTCIYARGSAAVGEKIISAATLTIELDDLRKHQKMKPDCIAIITSTCEEFVEKYPDLYGFKTYDEMATKLHEEFMTRMSRKAADLQELQLFIQNKCQLTKSSAENIISKLSIAEKYHSIETKKTEVNPNSNLELPANLLPLIPLGDKENSLLFKHYMNLSEVDLNRPFYGNTIEALIKELCERGPFIVTGCYGQAFYTVNSGTVTHDFTNQKMTVYGWAPNTFKEDPAIAQQQIIIIGARKDGDKKYVYYVCSPVSSANQNQIFVISHTGYMDSRKQIQSKTEQKALTENANYRCSVS